MLFSLCIFLCLPVSLKIIFEESSNFCLWMRKNKSHAIVNIFSIICVWRVKLVKETMRLAYLILHRMGLKGSTEFKSVMKILLERSYTMSLFSLQLSIRLSFSSISLYMFSLQFSVSLKALKRHSPPSWRLQWLRSHPSYFPSKYLQD